mmetsp:Transcript_3104/g.4484  ORF Transcript_3104/g.4484 Transcript_3104/m.4484 type:complete len:211 (-) Transcript_3104:141-773(-)
MWRRVRVHDKDAVRGHPISRIRQTHSESNDEDDRDSHATIRRLVASKLRQGRCRYVQGRDRNHGELLATRISECDNYRPKHPKRYHTFDVRSTCYGCPDDDVDEYLWDFSGHWDVWGRFLSTECQAEQVCGQYFRIGSPECTYDRRSDDVITRNCQERIGAYHQIPHGTAVTLSILHKQILWNPRPEEAFLRARCFGFAGTAPRHTIRFQ